MEPPALSVKVSPALWQAAPSFVSFTFSPGGYQHTIQAIGGYWSAQFQVPSNRLAVEEWLYDGLGRHVEVMDDTLAVCWEGFVNQVDAQIGGLSITRGPLVDVGNGLWVCYNPVIACPNGAPAGGSRTYTEYAADADSQARWGIRQKVVSGGTLSKLCAEYVRDVWLADNAEPATTQSFGGGGGLGATVQCLGYWHLLNFPYAELSTAGTIHISNPTTPADGKMQRILAAEPNGLMSADYTQMAENTTVDVEAHEDTDTDANELLRNLASMGDTGNRRYLVGLYAARRCRYNAAPVATAYHQVLTHPRQLITTPEGVEVKPWNVLPGRWLFYPDLMVGRQVPSRREDLRFEFIESVTYNSQGNPPVSHQGGKYQTLSTVLARWGLGGV